MSRLERIKLNLTFDKNAYDKHLKLIKQFPILHIPIVNDGETFYLNWVFTIEYFDTIDKAIEAMIEFTNDPTVILDCKVSELMYGRSLIKNLFDNLEKLIQGRVSNDHQVSTGEKVKKANDFNIDYD